MNLKFIKPKESASASKLTVQRTGKLGLSKGAITLLDVESRRYCKFAYEEESNEITGKILYMFLCKDSDDESFSISKAGDYYYIKAKSLLTDLEIDFEDTKKTVIFDIYPVNYQGEEIYKLKKREIKRK